MRFTNKVCLITGAGSGIGRATARSFAREGGRVLVIDINETGANETVQLIASENGIADFAVADVSKSSAVKAAVQKAVDLWGKIDVLVNNAAMMTFKTIHDLSEEEWDKVMAVNLKSVFLFSQFSLKHMNGGSIINVSSVHAHDTTPNVIPYAASKAAMESFARGMSVECIEQGVRVNCVAPGAVDTPMLWENPNVKSGKEKITGAIGQPDDIAEAICYLASDAAKYVNGTTLVVDGGRLNTL